jgi:hypothetical protein
MYVDHPTSPEPMIQKCGQAEVKEGGRSATAEGLASSMTIAAARLDCATTLSARRRSDIALSCVAVPRVDNE